MTSSRTATTAAAARHLAQRSTCSSLGELARAGAALLRADAVGVVSALDWVVLVGTLGVHRRLRRVEDARRAATWTTYFRGGNTLRWPTIGLSIMATQASAITFLSTPGQAYEDGMRFVQFYFGLPLAMVVISAVFVPIYYRLKVYTAYEYLEHRFDARVRYLGAVLFLIQRGLAAGITIYAPAIILSTILGWPLNADQPRDRASLVIAYTVSGGTRAVSQTQQQQMIVMLAGMVVAAVADRLAPARRTSRCRAALKLAGALDRMNVVSFELDFDNRYNFWSGITGGFFLALSYFGTDQSQVQRYLSGRSVAESRLGLLFNGMFKMPMQFVILLIGVLVFVFYLFTPAADLLQRAGARARRGAASTRAELQRARGALRRARSRRSARAADGLRRGAATADDARGRGARRAARARRRATDDAARRGQGAGRDARCPDAETKDADYVFLGFVLRYVPSGLVGLLIAVILCAAMSSTASELAALGSTTTVDLYKRLLRARRRAGAHDLLRVEAVHRRSGAWSRSASPPSPRCSTT